MVTVDEIMRTKFAALDETAQMGRLESEMKLENVRHVLIVDANGRLAGIVSRGDLARARDRPVQPQLREFLTRRVWTVRAGEPAIKAVDLMIDRNVGAIPVLDGDERPIGIVTETELLQRARQALVG